MARAAAVAFLLLIVAPSNQAAISSITLAVPDRANANVSLMAQGPFVVAVWSASAAGGDTDIYAAMSRDGGRAFSAPVRVNSTPGDARVNGEQPPRVSMKARPGQVPQIAVVWTTKGSAGTTLLYSSSTDGGRTFAKSLLVPGTDAPGNRGWEAIGTGPDGRFFSVWLDHRQLAAAQQMQMAGEHRHENGAAAAAPPAPRDGVAMAQLSQLYITPLDASIAPQGVTGGVCYCCKTAIAAGRGNSLYLAWRHVYAGNMRDIAFTVSRDGGKTFAAPVRVSEDKWQIEGCPDDGPSMAVDGQGAVHVVWPSVVSERGGPVKTLFHAMTTDGRTFTTRERIPTQGQANHPQLSIDAGGTLAVMWDESGSGTRLLASATGQLDRGGRVRFTRSQSNREIGSYPVLASIGAGSWVRAWTTGPPTASEIRIASFQ
ncbi:MAG TPA: sialidase family protein [Vicinamibacterales bacterium]|nr:sialidase family protein [Vicinamibacterales bacterium]